MLVETLFTPADFAALPTRDLSKAVCVVFDVLRATSTIVTAFAHGARSIRPLATIDEAVEERRRNPSVLLAGERNGLRIGPELAGGRAFDLGNSPREFDPDRVRDRDIVMTTTNGTRALKASAGAARVLAASFLNLSSAVAAIRAMSPETVLLVCSGTGEDAAVEDALAVGAACEALAPGAELADSARIAQALWRSAESDFPAAFASGRNARRLLAIPELAGDVEFCRRCDVYEVVPVLMRDGELRVAS